MVERFRKYLDLKIFFTEEDAVFQILKYQIPMLSRDRQAYLSYQRKLKDCHKLYMKIMVIVSVLMTIFLLWLSLGVQKDNTFVNILWVVLFFFFVIAPFTYELVFKILTKYRGNDDYCVWENYYKRNRLTRERYLKEYETWKYFNNFR